MRTSTKRPLGLGVSSTKPVGMRLGNQSTFPHWNASSQYTAAELGIQYNLGNYFTKTPEDMVFLVGRNGGLYLVNTGGYNYARNVRYVGVVVEKPVPDTLAYVVQALNNAGYFVGPKDPPGEREDGDDLLSATFAGINDTGKEMYDVTFNEEDGGIGKGRVFVWTKDGKKVADF